MNRGSSFGHVVELLKSFITICVINKDTRVYIYGWDWDKKGQIMGVFPIGGRQIFCPNEDRHILWSNEVACPNGEGDIVKPNVVGFSIEGGHLLRPTVAFSIGEGHILWPNVIYYS